MKCTKLGNIKLFFSTIQYCKELDSDEKCGSQDVLRKRKLDGLLEDQSQESQVKSRRLLMSETVRTIAKNDARTLCPMNLGAKSKSGREHGQRLIVEDSFGAGFNGNQEEIGRRTPGGIGPDCRQNV